jgi:hypothetical protein
MLASFKLERGLQGLTNIQIFIHREMTLNYPQKYKESYNLIRIKLYSPNINQ